MPQLLLPIIPHGATNIGGCVSVYRDDNVWTFFVGLVPIYSHRPDDKRMFRLVTASLIEAGACKHSDIVKHFGVSKSSVNRSVKKLRNGGSEAFFKKRAGRKYGTKLTPNILEQAQQLLDKGKSRNQIAEEIDVKCDTLRKAIEDGRLREFKHTETDIDVTDKSMRSMADAAAGEGMGIACTRVMDRVLSSLGKCNDGAIVRFEASHDVSFGGVLCALPALLANGLLDGVEAILGAISGYYAIYHVLLLLSFMVLGRIKTVEKLRGYGQGELGKLLGLDRIPEVRCLREKMDAMSAADAGEKWAVHLSRHWMKNEPESVGSLYIDGHVRVYNGQLTKLPRKYVARQRLCLRGISDYWVNDAIGRPFFKVEKPIDPGLIKVLEQDIVPRLLTDIPNQPESSQLDENPYLNRFIIIFDREGYSPAFFHKMWKDHRIACMTYHKYPGEAWPLEWFKDHKVVMPRGETSVMKLAEMGTWFGTGKDAFWVREVRKLTESGHQTSLISTAYDLQHTQLAAGMFSRWCQENFFKYMIQHFGIDLLNEYGIESFPDTEKVINPTWRDLDRSRNSLQNKLRYRKARFAEMTMHPQSEDEHEKYHTWVQKKSELLEEIEQYEHQLVGFKSDIKNTDKYIKWSELEEKDKFYRLIPGRKRLMDTIKMIAYRAETAMTGLLIDQTVDSAAARRLLQDLFVTDADILPEPEKNLLRVRVHSASRPAANRSLAKLFDRLNEADIRYPGPEMKMTYELIGREK